MIISYGHMNFKGDVGIADGIEGERIGFISRFLLFSKNISDFLLKSHM